MWHITFDNCWVGRLVGIFFGAVISMSAIGKSVANEADSKPWNDLPLPELGMRIVDGSPNDRTRINVWIRMPQVTGYSNVFDLECYECPRDLEYLGHRILESGVLELRHRRSSRPHILLVTELTPQPGKVQLVARLELDSEKGIDEIVLEDLPHLNMCPSLVRARGTFVLYAAYPNPFPEVINRCFIFTDKGRTFLNDTVRRNMPRYSDDDPFNNPPWIQVYRPVWEPVRAPSVGDTAYNNSSDRFTLPIIGAISLDKKHLIALANDSAHKVCQAWAPCLHNNPDWTPKDAAPSQRRWKINIYIMPNDPDMLLERVAMDLPRAFKLQENRVPAGDRQCCPLKRRANPKQIKE